MGSAGAAPATGSRIDMSFIIKAQGKGATLFFLRFSPDEQVLWCDFAPAAMEFGSKELAEQWMQRVKEHFPGSEAKYEVVEA